MVILGLIRSIPEEARRVALRMSHTHTGKALNSLILGLHPLGIDRIMEREYFSYPFLSELEPEPP